MPEIAEGGQCIIGPGNILEGRLTDDCGKPLAAHIRVFGHGNPFAFHEKPIGTMKALGGRNFAIFKFYPLAVTFLIGGIDFLDT